MFMCQPDNIIDTECGRMAHVITKVPAFWTLLGGYRPIDSGCIEVSFNLYNSVRGDTALKPVWYPW